jgi:general secretion pathway protein F
MIRAGEASGALDKIMEELANYIESQVNIRSKVVAASVYPALVFLVMIAVVALLMTFVIPKIARILEDAGQSIPFYTAALIFASNLMREAFPYILISIAVFIPLRGRIRNNRRVRLVTDTVKLKIPILSRLHLNSCIHRLFSTLATLTKAGVPIVRALDIAAEIVGNEILRRVVIEAKENIVEGGSMWEKFSASALFPPMVVHMVAIGERSGEIEDMFSHISRTLETEIETSVTTLTSMLEPILVVFMGSIVFFIMISILLPIFQINRTIM